MPNNLTIDDLIIEAHDGGQNCRSCPLCMDAEDKYKHCIMPDTDGLSESTCLTHTITLKPTPDEHL